MQHRGRDSRIGHYSYDEVKNEILNACATALLTSPAAGGFHDQCE